MSSITKMSGYRSVLALLVLLWIFCIPSNAAKSSGTLDKLTGTVLGQPEVFDEAKHAAEPVVEMVER